MRIQRVYEIHGILQLFAKTDRAGKILRVRAKVVDDRLVVRPHSSILTFQEAISR